MEMSQRPLNACLSALPLTVVFFFFGLCCRPERMSVAAAENVERDKQAMRTLTEYLQKDKLPSDCIDGRLLIQVSQLFIGIREFDLSVKALEQIPASSSENNSWRRLGFALLLADPAARKNRSYTHLVSNYNKSFRLRLEAASRLKQALYRGDSKRDLTEVYDLLDRSDPKNEDRASLFIDRFNELLIYRMRIGVLPPEYEISKILQARYGKKDVGDFLQRLDGFTAKLAYLGLATELAEHGFKDAAAKSLRQSLAITVPVEEHVIFGFWDISNDVELDILSTLAIVESGTGKESGLESGLKLLADELESRLDHCTIDQKVSVLSRLAIAYALGGSPSNATDYLSRARKMITEKDALDAHVGGAAFSEFCVALSILGDNASLANSWELGSVFFPQWRTDYACVVVQEFCRSKSRSGWSWQQANSLAIPQSCSHAKIAVALGYAQGAQNK
jgi:hypothetical protein